MEDLHEYKLSEIISALQELQTKFPGKDWKVRIPYTNGRLSCVGALVGSPERETVFLFPCPEDIDRVTMMRKLIMKLSCDDALKGQDCLTCPKLRTCEVMKRFEDNMKILHGDA